MEGVPLPAVFDLVDEKLRHINRALRTGTAGTNLDG
jgi:hypothetical protein